MKMNRLFLVPFFALVTINQGQAASCVDYKLSSNIVKKISASFLTETKPYRFGVLKSDDGTDDEGFYVDELDTIIYSKDMSSTVGFSAENNGCDLTYVHFEHDRSRTKKLLTSCDKVIATTLNVIAKNHSLFKDIDQAELSWNNISSETGPVMTNTAGKKIGIYDYQESNYQTSVRGKEVKISFELFKTKKTCFLSSVNVSQK